MNSMTNNNIKLIGITSKKDSLLYKNADVKFFMTANLKERSERRYKELRKLNHKITKSIVLLVIIIWKKESLR